MVVDVVEQRDDVQEADGYGSWATTFQTGAKPQGVC